MYKRLAFAAVPVAVAALAATMSGSLAASAATADDGPITAVAENVQLAGEVKQTGKLKVTVHNGTEFQDEGRFLVHMPQTARLVPGQQCVLYDWNLSQWLCEGTRLEAGESHTTTLRVRSILDTTDYHGYDVGYVQGLANSNAKSERLWFEIHWPAAPQ
ncbi:hypothetical protein GCM10010112_14690 [Actinoplanes lobatus]|uniref:Uncharacterized protein n=1 Tax=Actinoplanes lobatus TaxID=113568 RepID=A0A7W7MKE8_9ACTN|nr:hypothetical protein [Actinoplanes lobatus]MBB4753301.1 hypothetical protein [Actinoplanes lobatus]GGN59547.1 hypothetical protein GCM10010112_14690 [Actinoplanes lobatus]GIE37835.1 hypothetical protein Alo02nite_07330 [Actinoplanes lobatus]